MVNSHYKRRSNKCPECYKRHCSYKRHTKRHSKRHTKRHSKRHTKRRSKRHTKRCSKRHTKRCSKRQLIGGSKTICSTCNIFSSNKYGEYCCKTCRDSNGEFHGKSILSGASNPHPKVHSLVIPNYDKCCKRCGVFKRLKGKEKCCMSCDGTHHGKSITPEGISEHPRKCVLQIKTKSPKISTLTEWVFADKYRPLTKEEVDYSIQKEYESLVDSGKTKLKSLFFPIADIAKVNNISKKDVIDILKEKQKTGLLFSWNGDEKEIRFANSNNDFLFPKNYPLDKWIRKYLQKIAMKQ